MFRKLESEDIRHDNLVPILGRLLANALDHIDKDPSRKKSMSKVSGVEFKTIQTTWPRYEGPRRSDPTKA